MAEQVLAAVRTGPGTTELREFPMPEIPRDGALLKVEVAGICGTDVKMYAKPRDRRPVIMGHENVGIDRQGRARSSSSARASARATASSSSTTSAATAAPGAARGEYRHCELTDWRTNPDARRYGYTTSENPSHLWGGFAQYMYLPWNAVLHKVPDSVGARVGRHRHAAVERHRVGALRRRRRLQLDRPDPGPGPAGALAGGRVQAGRRLAHHRHRHDARRRPARAGQDARRRPHDRRAGRGPAASGSWQITGGAGVDVVLDCTAGAGTAPVLLGIDALKRRAGTIVIQGELAAFPDFPVKKMTEKAITIKSARGHSYRACELALAQLASQPVPAGAADHPQLRPVDVDRAIRAVGGEVE